MGKKSGSGINIPDQTFRELRKQFFGLKIIYFLMRIRIQDLIDHGDGKNSDQGSGINIPPDPQRL
jgi:hypothetical protein